MKIEKQQYKMLVLDMDYTLLNKNKEVSQGNKNAIKKAAEKGVLVVVATGRLYSSAKYYAKLLGLNTPVIASNGAIIKESHTNKTIYRSLLCEEAARKMIDVTKNHGLYCHFFAEDVIYTEKIINISKRYTEWNRRFTEADKVNIEVVPDLYELLNKEKGTILKAVVVDDDDEKILAVRNEILKTGMVTASQSLKDNVEVMNKGVSKGNAIHILAEMYGIKQEEIIAMGDNENDKSMIEYAGLGIAMGNAENCLKEVADYITGNYEEDGVAQAIEKFILSN